MYDIHIERRAEKELRKIDIRHQENVIKKISIILSHNPFQAGDNPKRLTCERAFRLRIGDYRVLYTIQGQQVLIYAIRHRKDAYQ